MAEFNLKSGNATPFKMMGSSPAKQIWMTMVPKSSKNKWTGKNPSYVKPTTKNPKKGLSQYDPKRGDDPYTPTTSYKSKHDTKVPGYRDPKRYKQPSIKLGISKEQFMKSKK